MGGARLGAPGEAGRWVSRPTADRPCDDSRQGVPHAPDDDPAQPNIPRHDEPESALCAHRECHADRREDWNDTFLVLEGSSQEDADSAMARYRAANNPEDAVRYRRLVEHAEDEASNRRTMSYVGLGVALAAIAAWLFLDRREVSEASLSTSPLERGALMNWSATW